MARFRDGNVIEALVSLYHGDHNLSDAAAGIARQAEASGSGVATLTQRQYDHAETTIRHFSHSHHCDVCGSMIEAGDVPGYLVYGSCSLCRDRAAKDD